MISFWAERDQRNCLTIKSPLAFFVNLFKKKKYKVRKNHVKESRHCGVHPKVPIDLSVSVMDMRMSSPCPLSPALSTLTLTPGRIRDIDQDMEALRLSRQDNPFLQVLASRESLVESTYESVSDDTNLMSQEFPNETEVDPLSLPEIHEHMIRSPPPTTWPKSPNFKVFRFPVTDSDDSLQGNYSQCGSIKKSSGSIRDEEETISKCYKNKETVETYGSNYSTTNSASSLQVDISQKRSNSESRGNLHKYGVNLSRSTFDPTNSQSVPIESLSNLFPMFRPMRSLSDIRRPTHQHQQQQQPHGNNTTDDQGSENMERKFDDEILPTLPLLPKRFS